MQTDTAFHTWVEASPQDALVLVASGPVDTVSAAQFKGLLLATVERRAPRTIIDLTQMSSIDSTGLGVW